MDAIKYLDFINFVLFNLVFLVLNWKILVKSIIGDTSL